MYIPYLGNTVNQQLLKHTVVITFVHETEVRKNRDKAAPYKESPPQTYSQNLIPWLFAKFLVKMFRIPLTMRTIP